MASIGAFYPKRLMDEKGESKLSNVSTVSKVSTHGIARWRHPSEQPPKTPLPTTTSTQPSSNPYHASLALDCGLSTAYGRHGNLSKSGLRFSR